MVMGLILTTNLMRLFLLLWVSWLQQVCNKDTASYQRVLVLDVDRLTQPLGAFFSVNPLLFHWSKAKEMEMGEGSARVSWYERLLLIGPITFFIDYS